MFLVPPSALNPKDIAIASIMVDFPEPFPPIIKVTGFSNRISFKFLIIGILKGDSSKSSTRFLFNLIPLINNCRIEVVLS